MPPCLTLSIIRYGSRVKWSNPGKGVAPFPTPWCSSYRKGSLRVTLDYGRQLYLLISLANQRVVCIIFLSRPAIYSFSFFIRPLLFPFSSFRTFFSLDFLVFSFRFFGCAVFSFTSFSSIFLFSLSFPACFSFFSVCLSLSFFLSFVFHLVFI